MPPPKRNLFDLPDDPADDPEDSREPENEGSRAGYNFSDKMRVNREQWQLIKVKSISIMLPEEGQAYLRAIASIITGEKLESYIEAHHPEVLEAFSERRPRLGFDPDMLRHLMREWNKKEVAEDHPVIGLLQTVGDLFNRSRQAHASAKMEANKGNEQAVRYWFAMEYALCHQARGYWTLLEMRLETDSEPPAWLGRAW